MPNIGRQRTGASTVHIPWRFVSLSRTRPRSVRTLLSALGGIIAVVTAFAFPAGYAVIGHLKQADQLARKAELTAARVASHIQAPITRHSDPDQLAAISELLTASAVPLVQRIVDPHGSDRARKGYTPAVAHLHARGSRPRLRRAHWQTRDIRQHTPAH